MYLEDYALVVTSCWQIEVILVYHIRRVAIFICLNVLFKIKANKNTNKLSDLHGKQYDRILSTIINQLQQ